MIRPATPQDADAINAIYNHYVLHSTATYQEEPDTLRDRLAWLEKHGPQHPVVVIENEAGLVIGWASLSPFHPRSAYRYTVENSIYLAPDQQGKGLGTRLLQYLLDTAQALGHQQMVALISSDQTASKRLHAATGFVQAGQLQRVGLKFGQWLDLEFWQRSL